MPNLTSITKFFTKPKEQFASTLNGSITNTDTTIAVSSLSGYTNGDIDFFTIDFTDSAGNPTPSKTEVVQGEVSGSNLINVVRGIEGTAQSHANGANIISDVTAAHQGSTTKGLLVEHKLTGAHANITADSATINGDLTATGTIQFNGTTGGWTGANESWSFSSWDATNKTGVITVPSNATNKYSAGMRIRISQTTGGTKYGIITKVETTALTAYFGTDYTLNNEAISSPHYSVHKAPHGFPLDPAKWTATATSTSDRSAFGNNVWSSLTDTIVVPIGAWELSMKVLVGTTNSSGATRRASVTLSTTTNSETNPNITAAIADNNNLNNHNGTLFGKDFITTTSATTYTLLGKANNTASLTATTLGSAQATVFRAICAYL